VVSEDAEVARKLATCVVAVLLRVLRDIIFAGNGMDDRPTRL
jgi:hypothetical protein